MVNDYIKGYIEGMDLTKIPVQHLTYPSKNVIVTKGKVVTRGGLTNDGTPAVKDQPIHSEFLWKDAQSGQRPLRFSGNEADIKINGKWFTFYTGFSTAEKVRTATWVDSNNALIKKRLFLADGSPHMYQWNGAVATVESFANDTITIEGNLNAYQVGFDDGTTVNQEIVVLSLDTNGNVTETNVYAYDNDATTKDLHLTTTPTTSPKAGDIVIANIVKFENKISDLYNIDALYNYQNHICVGSFDKVEVYLSHMTSYDLATGLDFSVPTPSSRTAVSPILLRLDGHFRAFIGKKSVLWVSDIDDWYKVTKTVEQNAYGMWVTVDKIETGEQKGAMKMAVTKYKGDIIYLAQDKTLQRITTVEVLNNDEIKNISDEVEGLFKRLDFEGVEIYYFERAIYLVLPKESILLIFDLIEGYYQPPQVMPISCMTYIGGVLYGHHNSNRETYQLFKGDDDLGVPIESVIAFGLYSGDHSFRYKKHTMVGVSCRITRATKVKVENYFEEDGSKSKHTFEIDGEKIKTYAIDDDTSWGTHPYATRSLGGADMEVKELRRAMVFNKNIAESYFDYRPIFKIFGRKQEFHLLAWYIDSAKSNIKIGNDLFIKK